MFARNIVKVPEAKGLQAEAFRRKLSQSMVTGREEKSLDAILVVIEGWVPGKNRQSRCWLTWFYNITRWPGIGFHIIMILEQ